MQIDQPFNKLRYKILSLILGKSFSLFKYIIESIIATQFHKNVNILVIFENMIEPNNSPMLQCLMNLDFSNELNYYYFYFLLSFCFF